MGLWRKTDTSSDRGSYAMTRFIVPSKDGSRWEIGRTTRVSSGINFLDAIAYPTSRLTSQSCPTGLQWRVYQFRDYFAKTRDVKVEVV